MALRQPPVDLDPGKLQLTGAATDIRWQDYSCTLVTPLYGGGVKAGEVDVHMPIRASAIRGHLRFWWRLLAKHKYKLNPDEIGRQEFALWGGLGDTPQASNVWVRIDAIQNLDVARWAEYETADRGGYKSLPTPAKWAEVPYALFPAQGKKPGLADSADPHGLAKPGLTWALHLGLHYPENAEASLRENLDERVHEALRWWASFGGVGARTRRGLGAFQMQDSDKINIASIGVEEAAEAGCRLYFTTAAPQIEANDPWISSIKKLKEFRQEPNLGRNPGATKGRPGRSRWPEPAAIRSATGGHRIKNDGVSFAPPQNTPFIFPRAAFGLPIVFHFQGERNDRNPDPADVTLEPAEKKNGAHIERMASPLILRPYLGADGKWKSAALVLPSRLSNDAQLVLRRGKNAIATGHVMPKDTSESAFLHPNNPMHGRGGDALEAFVHYFSGKTLAKDGAK